MPFKKMCAHCQKPFNANYRKAQFCSNQCANTVIAVQRTVQSDEEVKVYLLDHSCRPDGDSGCWVWQGSMNDSGYGIACVRQGSFRASRLAYEIFVGHIPDSLHILHDPVKCTMRACINPQHLRCGTNYENVQDRAITETVQHGENHYRTDLIDNDIREIRRLCNAEHWTYLEIGTKYGLDFVTVHDIVKAKTWKHVDAETYLPPGDKKQKLTPEDYETIYALRREGLIYRAIAERLNNKVKLEHIAKLCKKAGLN